MLTANAAGMKLKTQSLKSVITTMKVGIFTLQETHFLKKGKLQTQGWQTFESIRKMKGGGSMIGAHESLNPILIKEYSDEFELIVIEITIKEKYIRVITGYGSQEAWKSEDKMPFFLALEEEVAKAEIAGKSVIIGFDANSKLGPKWIKQDPHSESQNGNILGGIIQRYALIVANGDPEKCSGAITRRRATVDGVEVSAIDFIILSQDIESAYVSLDIDEDKIYSLTSCAGTKKGPVTKDSDHNSLSC